MTLSPESLLPISSNFKLGLHNYCVGLVVLGVPGAYSFTSDVCEDACQSIISGGFAEGVQRDVYKAAVVFFQNHRCKRP